MLSSRLGAHFAIRALTPFDFLNVKGGIPFTFFGITAGKTIYEQVMAANPAHQKQRADDEARLIEIVLQKGLINPALAEVLNHDQKMILAGEIVYHSMQIIRQEIIINYANSIEIDIIARRYAKSPIEVLFPSGGYNSMDAYMFNRFVASHAMKYEADKVKNG